MVFEHQQVDLLEPMVRALRFFGPTRVRHWLESDRSHPPNNLHSASNLLASLMVWCRFWFAREDASPLPSIPRFHSCFSPLASDVSIGGFVYLNRGLSFPLSMCFRRIPRVYAIFMVCRARFSTSSKPGCSFTRY